MMIAIGKGLRREIKSLSDDELEKLLAFALATSSTYQIAKKELSRRRSALSKKSFRTIARQFYCGIIKRVFQIVQSALKIR